MINSKAKLRNIHYSQGDVLFDTVVYIILIAVFFITAYPLYFVVIASISEPAKVSSGAVAFWPLGINFAGYAAILKDPAIVRSFFNAVWYTVLGTTFNIIVTVPAAYGLSRRDLKGRGLLTFYFLIPMYITPFLVPSFLVVRSLGMYNTIWALIIPAGVNVYNLIIARSFFSSSMSPELLEAAKIDGCTNTRFLFGIVIPLSSSIIAILVLFYGVAHWNSYFVPMIFLNDARKFPFQLVLRTILSQNNVSSIVKDHSELLYKQQLAELMKYSLIIVSSIPVMLLYPLVQKHFVKGVMIGSLKG